MISTRRQFLRNLRTGLMVAAAPAVLVPEKRFWQVHPNTPLRSGHAGGATITYNGPYEDITERARGLRPVRVEMSNDLDMLTTYYDPETGQLQIRHVFDDRPDDRVEIEVVPWETRYDGAAYANELRRQALQPETLKELRGILSVKSPAPPESVAKLRKYLDEADAEAEWKALRIEERG